MTPPKAFQVFLSPAVSTQTEISPETTACKAALPFCSLALPPVAHPESNAAEHSSFGDARHEVFLSVPSFTTFLPRGHAQNNRVPCCPQTVRFDFYLIPSFVALLLFKEEQKHLWV